MLQDRMALDEHGNHPCLGSGALENTSSRHLPLSYRQLDAFAGRLASGLAERGVAPGDRVVCQVDKGPAALALYLAVLRHGAVYVPLNPAYTKEEVRFFLEDAAPHLFVGRSAARQELEPLAHKAGVQAVEWLAGMTEETEARTGPDFAEQVAELDPSPEIAARQGSDLAGIFYTSGTTGRSKGAGLTHRNLAENATALHAAWGFEEGDVLLHALPIFHIHGLFVALHTALLNRSTVIFHPAFDPQAIVRDLPRATVFMGVPTFYARLLQTPGFDRECCWGMRLFTSGSAPLSPETFDAFYLRTGQRILERYGMTEIGIALSNPLDGERIAGTVGFPFPGHEVRVADDSGNPVPPGTVGTLEVKGPSVFAGYWQLPEKTAEEFRGDGFFITGDLATEDAEGRISIVGRARDLVISGGYNIYPREIEDCLLGVAGVSECAVIGAPHDDLGEGVVAVLVAENPEEPVANEDLQAALDGSLARFKHPRRFFWTAALPRNSMGKVQKNVLRDEHRDTYRGS